MPGEGQLLRPRSKKSIGPIDKDHAGELFAVDP